MARNPLTDYYEIDLTVNLIPRNQYHDALDEGHIKWTSKLKLLNLAQLGYLLAQIQEAVERTKEASR